MENKEKTFWQLISEHKVEIPIIQRDYAQGRDNKKAKQVREDFIKDLLKSIQFAGDSNRLHLDFVYGKIKGQKDKVLIERNRKSVKQLLSTIKDYAKNLSVDITYELDQTIGSQNENYLTTFVPLDGQQRLTTLFLLHWYLSFRLKESQSLLFRFTYKTRKSSKEFCSALVTNTNVLELSNSSLTEAIEDAHWFVRTWKKDPTVSGILVVLDLIHSQLSDIDEEDLRKFWNNLTDNNQVYFDFLDLDYLELEDDLYVKMNARGKHLSDFENFKAWLLGSDLDLKDEFGLYSWREKIDKEWIDIFWKFRSGYKGVDNSLMMFFKYLGLYNFSLSISLENDKLKQEDAPIINALEKNEYMPTSVYLEKNIFDEHRLKRGFSFLYYLEGSDFSIFNEFKSQFEPFFYFKEPFQNILFSKLQNQNLPTKVFLYCLYEFVIRKSKRIIDYNESDELELYRWLRVMSNLIFNTRIDDNRELVRAIKAVNKISNNCFDILSFIQNQDSDIPYFRNEQREDETQKAKLILEDSLDWEPLFMKYERQEYLYGQLGFLIELSKGEDEKSDINQFIKYADSFSTIFTENNLKSPDYIIERALLAKGDYLIAKGSNRYSFCLPNMTNSRWRDENWRIVFNNPEKRQILKELLEDEYALENINSESFDYTNWRKYFIDDPELIAYCKQRLIRWENEGYSIKLLGSSKLSGYHRELYSYVLFKEVRDCIKSSPFRKIEYAQQKRSSVQPFFKFFDWSGLGSRHELKISFNNNEKVFFLEFIPEDSDEINIHEIVKNVLLQNEFEARNNTYRLKIDFQEISKVTDIISHILNELNSST
jgi:hypothetical protein